DGVSAEDVQRAWVIQQLLRRGASAPAIATADQREEFLDRCVEQIFPRGILLGCTLAQASEQLGIGGTPLADAIRRSELFPAGILLDDAALEALRHFKAAIEAGSPADAMAQLMRVYADALARVAEAETRLFHFYVHAPLQARDDLSPRQAAAASAASG